MAPVHVHVHISILTFFQVEVEGHQPPGESWEFNANSKTSSYQGPKNLPILPKKCSHQNDVAKGQGLPYSVTSKYRKGRAQALDAASSILQSSSGASVMSITRSATLCTTIISTSILLIAFTETLTVTTDIPIITTQFPTPTPTLYPNSTLTLNSSSTLGTGFQTGPSSGQLLTSSPVGIFPNTSRTIITPSLTGVGTTGLLGASSGGIPLYTNTTIIFLLSMTLSTGFGTGTAYSSLSFASTTVPYSNVSTSSSNYTYPIGTGTAYSSRPLPSSNLGPATNSTSTFILGTGTSVSSVSASPISSASVGPFANSTSFVGTGYSKTTTYYSGTGSGVASVGTAFSSSGIPSSTSGFYPNSTTTLTLPETVTGTTFFHSLFYS